MPRPLRVFLCHAREDKFIVRELYRQLTAEGWMDVWLDEQKLLPGQEWDIEIEKAVEQADVVIVCLSNKSIDKEGYVQKELRFVLNIADEKPEGSIFVVPLRLDDCVVPRRIRAWQYVDYFPKINQTWAYQRLIESLRLRTAKLDISIDKSMTDVKPQRNTLRSHGIRVYMIISAIIVTILMLYFGTLFLSDILAPATEPPAATESPDNQMTMVFVPQSEFTMGSEGYDDEKPIHMVTLDAYWIDQTEVTNAMFAKFIVATGYETESQKKGKSHIFQSGVWIETNGADWQHPTGPNSNIFGREKHPVIHVSWNDATAYCEWRGDRLPTESEWEKAARGTDKRTYPWGNKAPNNTLLNYNFNIGDTTEVGKYSDGISPLGALDMAGNVWEWVEDWYSDTYYQNSPSSNPLGPDAGINKVVRGGSWSDVEDGVRASYRGEHDPSNAKSSLGFRCARSQP